MTHKQPLRQLRLLAVITTARRLFDALNTTQCLSTAGREQRRMLNLSHRPQAYLSSHNPGKGHHAV